jgi:hypothetical protein
MDNSRFLSMITCERLLPDIRLSAELGVQVIDSRLGQETPWTRNAG